MRFIVIGITDNPQPFFPPEVLDIIKSGKFFSGGRRHHEIVAALLPNDAEWIDITVPLDEVFNRYKMLPQGACMVVFASGDPLFFGFANTIRRKMPEAEIQLFPSFNSLQTLAHRLVMPYHDLRIVSLTGRPWPELDRALIEQTPKIGILTDREHTPQTIAQRMLDYGYDNYMMHVGAHLGNPDSETVFSLSLKEAATREFGQPNCVILQQTVCRERPFGIPDNAFALLDGREKMITKMPIRLLTLQSLDLRHASVLWDIGFCTGSVSIEARLQFPHLHIVAFEIRQECEDIIQSNMRRHGAPDITIIMGDFLSTDISMLPRPDAVFIGGHGGQLEAVMQKVLTVLNPGGCIVMNSVVAPKVTTDSRQLWDEACQTLGLQQLPPLHIQLNEHHPITILKCEKKPLSR